MAAYLWYRGIQIVCFTEQLATVKSAVKMKKLIKNRPLKSRSLIHIGLCNGCRLHEQFFNVFGSTKPFY